MIFVKQTITILFQILVLSNGSKRMLNKTLIDTPILQGHKSNFSTQVIAQGSQSHCVFGAFDYQFGPKLIGSNLPNITENFALLLFPAKWCENGIFAFEHDNKYGLATGAVSPKIVHPRGSLHSTIALVSDTVCFSKKHYDFLIEASNLIHNFDGDFSMEEIMKVYERYEFQIPCDSIHPLFPFYQKGSVCNIFKDRPESLLTVWRFRMAKLKIVVAASQFLTPTTDLSYFIAAIGLPFCKIEQECDFHIDMIDAAKYHAKRWLVCGVTHLMMQREEIGDLTVKENGLLTISGNNKWFRKGHGEIVSELRSIIASRNDEDLIKRMMKLTHDVMALGEAGSCVTIDQMREIGLDAGNAEFLAYWFHRNNCRAEVEIPNCCC
ncbi:hypothetical protein TRFO_35899 [Tritrichomonas foetus]|uniref:Uncharacterized protein n=1 Tax=Tritrichomonas foetus TaxID=1144522 RepID=A0A1J4JGH5_9EUKA|nr:hypothetical protein TRFO_35899 [Tritrichomonas foetus]|eukprot:OHS97769.1 hypothetical protein TRFO_35899 [Tritrichomonas foetus]